MYIQLHIYYICINKNNINKDNITCFLKSDSLRSEKPEYSAFDIEEIETNTFFSKLNLYSDGGNWSLKMTKYFRELFKFPTRLVPMIRKLRIVRRSTPSSNKCFRMIPAFFLLTR